MTPLFSPATRGFSLKIYQNKLNIDASHPRTTFTMPPRLPVLTALARKGISNSSPFTSLLLPFLQSRSASILGSLSDNPGAYSHRIRRGRGPSSGKGKTSGRGHKGQRQHGKVPARFQGGQTPPDVVHGLRGFKNQYVFPFIMYLPSRRSRRIKADDSLGILSKCLL